VVAAGVSLPAALLMMAAPKQQQVRALHKPSKRMIGDAWQ
jgi:hypothetical protein